MSTLDQIFFIRLSYYLLKLLATPLDYNPLVRQDG